MADAAAQAPTDAGSAQSLLAQGATQPPAAAATAAPAGSLLAQAGQPDGQQAPPADAKPADQGGTPQDAAKPEEKAPETAPEAYADFTVPEGMALDKGLVERFAPVFKGLNLSQAKAQELVTAFAEHAKAQAEASAKAVADQRAAWQAQVKGQPNWREQATLAHRALQTVGDQAAAELFSSTWLGDNPVVLGFLAKVGTLLREDPSRTQPAGAPARDLARVMYPTMTKP